MCEITQITKRSMQGKPVFPMMIRKDPRRSSNIDSWNEIIESGVRVKPRSLNKEAGVNIPLNAHVSPPIDVGRVNRTTYHQLLFTPSLTTTEPQVAVRLIQGRNTITPSTWNKR